MNWQPSKCLESPELYQQKFTVSSPNQGRFALIILNQPILIQRHLFENVWRNDSVRMVEPTVCMIFSRQIKNGKSNAKYLPDFIRGDFDSLKDHVKDYYASKGVPMEQLDDQESTDFMKCVELVRERDPKPPTNNNSNAATTIDYTPTTTDEPSEQQQQQQQQQQLQDRNLGIVALGGTGGRFDQCMSSIHHLYLLNRERHATLVSDESIVVVMGAGKHEITCNLEIEGPSCGIIPVGSSVAHLTTTGLKWDIENWRTSFGTRLSTSNALVGSEVIIETDAPVVWTTELRS
ncbi:cAMP-dependent protein kinase subunit [Podila humilis]|nr:cAMP-dependent protein kinase subunit [Podila humilis]